MATRDSFTQVNDGDIIADGWFNGAHDDVKDIIITGDGADGAFTSSGAETLAAGVHRFTSFTLSSGHTLTTTAATNKLPLVILVSGSAVLDGTVNLQEKGLSISDSYDAFGAIPSTPIDDAGVPVTGHRTRVKIVQAVESGQVPYTDAATDDVGGPGGVTAIAGYLKDQLYKISPLNIMHMLNGAHGGQSSSVKNGSGGGGGASAINFGSDGTDGAGGGTSVTRADGGKGGCSFILICDGDLDVSGTVNVSGENGNDFTETDAAGAGGGGSGIIFMAYGGTLTETSPTYTVNGGNGGSGSGGGQDGGDGGDGSTYKVPFSDLISKSF